VALLNKSFRNSIPRLSPKQSEYLELVIPQIS